MLILVLYIYIYIIVQVYGACQGMLLLIFRPLQPDRLGHIEFYYAVIQGIGHSELELGLKVLLGFIASTVRV